MSHTHTGYPQTITLEYDADGRMTRDEAGRTLGYDATGRLVSVSGQGISGGIYGYDALDRLVSQHVSDSDTRQLYYRADELVNEVLTAQGKERRWIKSGHATLGVSEDASLMLTAGDHHDSLLWSRDTSQKEGEQHAWSPYGNGGPEDGLPSFNGERADPVSGTYHLGNGYRAYNPVLMRFNCPDSLSPFGAGGINSYAYCAGDPVNFTDPSGHISAAGWAGIGLGILGILGAVVTGGLSVVAAAIGTAVTAGVATGASISTAGAVTAAIGSASAVSLTVGALGVVADVTAIASGATEDVNPAASSALGWVSMATGLAGLGISAGQGIRGAMKNKGNYNVTTQTEGVNIATTNSAERTTPQGASLQNLTEPPLRLRGGGPVGEARVTTGFVEEAKQTMIHSMTRGNIPLSSSSAPRQQLSRALGNSKNGEGTFTQLLRGVNENLASHGDSILTSEHAARYANISRQVENGNISNTTAHLQAVSEWARHGGGAGLTGTLFNGAGAVFSGAIDAIIRKRGW
ncbi:RHS repeat-associated core domain-containing protein [Xenorhabdus khoisanae]|uniref:RHS repeat-associated core domain-containing protein n=1 Tax=Xenorhabdus khoisanae TaxID=880157 RepID=UPI001F44D223|nr:RHS repeat-associated core domain-containing protein [Xenorhabdus khoisanae]